MARALVWIGVAAALAAGVALSLFVFSAGSLFGEAPEELVIRATNTGSHEADFTLDADRLRKTTFILAPGATHEERIDSPPRRQIPIALKVLWSVPGDVGEGTHREIADGRACPAGRLLVTFRVDTTLGVAVESTADCT